eukprot:COSAG01_NODE_63295_length_280_cov_1.408840_1_plen_31_part_01
MQYGWLGARQRVSSYMYASASANKTRQQPRR